MIPCSTRFNLGRDTTRIKDPADASRQKRTVEAVLERFFNSSPNQRSEVQIVADEVGMGKTFVALGVAYSVLQYLKAGGVERDLENCYQRVVVLTPNNHALFKKWCREVAEFKGRCVVPGELGEDLAFEAEPIERLDDLAVVLRKGGRQRKVLVARMGLFGGDRLMDYELKRRFMLGVLFRHWGVRFNRDLRERLLRGAPEDWPRQPDSLTEVSKEENDRLPFDEGQLLDIIESLPAENRETVESLLQLCRELAAPYFRDRDEKFRQIKSQLVAIYRLAAARSIQRDFPLLIVDDLSGGMIID